MDQHDFEKAIRAQRFGKIPDEWKQELLAEARASSPAPAQPAGHALGLVDYLCRLLWPCPEAWAALAAIWLALLIANSALAHSAPANRAHAASPVAVRSYKEQEKLLVELLGEPQPGLKSARPTATPSPQSSRRENLFHA